MSRKRCQIDRRPKLIEPMIIRSDLAWVRHVAAPARDEARKQICMGLFISVETLGSLPLLRRASLSKRFSIERSMSAVEPNIVATNHFSSGVMA